MFLTLICPHRYFFATTYPIADSSFYEDRLAYSYTLASKAVAAGDNATISPASLYINPNRRNTHRLNRNAKRNVFEILGSFSSFPTWDAVPNSFYRLYCNYTSHTESSHQAYTPPLKNQSPRYEKIRPHLHPISLLY